MPDGVFVKPDCQPLRQIAATSISPTAEGVVIITPLEATPYLSLTNPVSKGALALLAVAESRNLHGGPRVSQVRFQAQRVPSADPILVNAALVQMVMCGLIRQPLPAWPHLS